MEIPNVSDRKERKRFLEELQECVNEKGYPYCNSSLVYDLLVGFFTIDDACKDGFDEFAEDVESVISGVVEPLESYTEANDEDEGTDRLSGEELAASMCVYPWYEAMGSLITVEGESLKCGDLVNRSMQTNDVKVAINGFEMVEDVLRQDLGLAESVDSVPSDSPYSRIASETETSMDEVFVYFVLMMSFHRVMKDSRISESAMRAP